jgi:hypothetical protein
MTYTAAIGDLLLAGDVARLKHLVRHQPAGFRFSPADHLRWDPERALEIFRALTRLPDSRRARLWMRDNGVVRLGGGEPAVATPRFDGNGVFISARMRPVRYASGEPVGEKVMT